MAGLWERLHGFSARPSEMIDEARETDELPPLLRLVGEVLSSVTFVADYVQFDFSGAVLSAFVWPDVEVFDDSKRPGDVGYRDALVSLISREVTSVEDSRATGVVLRFDRDALRINPEPGDLQGPEIAMLQTNHEDRAWEVWRPGEGSFAGRDW